ncbi:MAG: polysaccharide pyruvyl transferase family protein [Ruminococcus sp.]|nr:polysaccharide pyruvyl transferase family protein [Ruminococcus sp.]
MIKTGVITKYHNNWNFGGLLQAYALVETLKGLGYEAEQISYVQNKKIPIKNRLTALARNTVMKIKSHRLVGFYKPYRDFMNEIPHTELYNCKSVSRTNDIYDNFIVGSDQVWNPLLCTDGYFLEFADKHKNIISYAASIGVESLDDRQKDFFAKKLKYFDAVSLREKNLVDTLSEITQKEVVWTPDPTLLLTSDKWENVARRVIDKRTEKPYVLTYLLGGNDEHFRLAETLAQRENLTVINIPFTINDYLKNKNNIHGIGPREFLWLIKNAEYVLTDSFHATVFSILFGVKFGNTIREMNGNPKTSSRIDSLYEMLGISERWVVSDDDFEKIKALPDADGVEKSLSKVRKTGLEFLTKSLGA